MRSRSRLVLALSLIVFPVAPACVSSNGVGPAEGPDASPCVGADGVDPCLDGAVVVQPDTGCAVLDGVQRCRDDAGLDATLPEAGAVDADVADTTVADSNEPETSAPDAADASALDATDSSVGIVDAAPTSSTQGPPWSTPGPDAACVVDVSGDYYVRTDDRSCVRASLVGRDGEVPAHLEQRAATPTATWATAILAGRRRSTSRPRW